MWASQVVVKNLPANEGDIRDMYSILDPGRFPGEENGNPLQYSCLENPMERWVCRLQSTESQRVGYEWRYLACTHAHTENKCFLSSLSKDTVLIWSWSSKTLVTWCEEPNHWKISLCWERPKAKGDGAAKDVMVGWHHQLNGHDFEQTQEDSEGQDAWRATVHGVTESDTT